MKKSTIILCLLLLGGGFYLGTHFSKKGLLPSKNKVQNSKQVAYDTDNNETEENNNAEEEGLSKRRTVGENSPYNDSELATINLFEDSAPSVVFITTTAYRQDRWSMDIFEIPQGSGTGFIWDKDGHIVTNHHVIEGGSRCTVTLADQTSYDATVVGVAPDKDLAVLRIHANDQDLRPIPVGRSSDLRVGQSVHAIGNPFGLDQSLTKGIISALGREITTQNNRIVKDVIQSDAAINPGNSGGPLLDSSGRLIGVNTAIYSPSGASAGIGFSIPSDVVNFVVPDLINFGEVRKPIIGVELVPNQYFNGKGSMLKYVGENTPAERAGLRGVQRDNEGKLISGDVIIQVNNMDIESNNDLILALEKFKIGEEIFIKYVRDKKLRETNLTLASSIKQ